MTQYTPRPFKAMLSAFFRTEAAGGMVLIAMAGIALLVVNSPLSPLYDRVMHGPIHFVINDGLMAIFFLLIGLEIKRELVVGQLSSRELAMLPVLAAIGGMAVPALVYYSVNHPYPDNLAGWAIPTATDIAFAICVIAMTGSRVPASVKILLLAIAVMDDLGAIIIIALFYGHGFDVLPFAAAVALMGVMVLLNRRRVTALWPYLVLGAMLWGAVLESGLHATLAGVLTALAIPLRGRTPADESPLHILEHGLHPWVAFLILPLFGFANAGVSFAGIGWSSLSEPVTLGILLGLLLGKPVGIFALLFAAIKLRISPMPLGATWTQLFGMSVLCGIGFTMSLFIGGLAFADHAQDAAIRLGVLGGSVVAAIIGYTLLYYGLPFRRQRP